MSKNFVRKTFDHWIKINRTNFKYQPRIVKSRKNYFELKFDGIAPELACLISNRGDCMITVDYNDTCWDIICEFDVWERRNPKGQYYCDGCLPEYKEFYSSREELRIKHCFEPLLKWTNENFNRSNFLCLWGDKEGSTSACIKTEHEVKDFMLGVDFSAIAPLVLSKRL